MNLKVTRQFPFTQIDQCAARAPFSRGKQTHGGRVELNWVIRGFTVGRT